MFFKYQAHFAFALFSILFCISCSDNKVKNVTSSPLKTGNLQNLPSVEPELKADEEEDTTPQSKKSEDTTPQSKKSEDTTPQLKKSVELSAQSDNLQNLPSVEPKLKADEEEDTAPQSAQSEELNHSENLISYQNQSIGNIHLNMTKESAEKVLTLDHITDGIHHYKEKVVIKWDEQTGKPKQIGAFTGYQGAFDFGPEMGGSLKIEELSIDSNISNQAELAEFLINLIKSIYNHLENTNIDCIQEEKCNIEIFPGKEVSFLIDINLPKANLFLIFNYNEQSFHAYGIYFFTEEEKEKRLKISTNSEIPIGYQNQSAGNININTPKKEAEKILTLKEKKGEIHFYQEGLGIRWNQKGEVEELMILPNYQGAFDFGPSLGGQHTIGASLSHYSPDPQTFVAVLYNYLENTSINCLKDNKCSILANENNAMIFKLPKVYFYISNQGLLLRIGFIKETSSNLENKE